MLMRALYRDYLLARADAAKRPSAGGRGRGGGGGGRAQRGGRGGRGANIAEKCAPGRRRARRRCGAVHAAWCRGRAIGLGVTWDGCYAARQETLDNDMARPCQHGCSDAVL